MNGVQIWCTWAHGKLDLYQDSMQQFSENVRAIQYCANMMLSDVFDSWSIEALTKVSNRAWELLNPIAVPERRIAM